MPRLKTHDRQLRETGDAPPLLLKGCKIWSASGFSEATVLLEDGKISRIRRIIEPDGARTISAHGLIALPGLVDAHVHLRDLELSYKEDFTTGTAAAVAGGYTSVLDMPNTQPPTDSEARLLEKLAMAEGRIIANVGFHAAAVRDETEIEQLSRAGAFSLKLYMPRPISPLNVQDDQVLLRLLSSAKKKGLPVTVHAEDEESLTPSKSPPRSFLEMAKTRPEQAETNAVDRILRLARRTGCRIHLAHLTLPSSIESSNRNRNVTTEVTPHHLLLSERTLAKQGWRAWMVPPLRRESVRSKLLSMMSADKVSIVASDHAPHSIMEKSRSQPDKTPPGIPGLETTLPLMLTLVKRGVLSFHLIPRLLSTMPAHVFKLGGKGKLQRGFDGDIVLVDVRWKGRIRADLFQSKAKYSPFDRMPIVGRVHTTIVDGKVVYENGEVIGKPGSGRILTRSA